MMNIGLRKVCLAGALFLGAQSAWAADAWTLDGAQSTLNYVSIKSAQIAENNHFAELSGQVSDSGQLTLSIGLGSVQTGIDIRNERMGEHFFKVAQFAEATLSAELSDELMASLSSAGIQQATVPATLSLHGASKGYSVALTIASTGEQLMVSNTTPILVSAADFGLAEGLNKLQELAGLPSITQVVPVNATLVFKK